MAQAQGFAPGRGRIGVAVTVPWGDALLVAVSALVANVVQESP